MTIEQMREKTRQLHAKTRRALLGGIGVSVVVAGIGGAGITWAGSALVRAMFAFAVLWSLAGQYFLNRGMWPEDAGLSNGLQAYRKEVERRQSLASGFLLWSFGPVALALAMLILLLVSFGGTPAKMAPFLTALLVWLAGVFVIRMRERRELRREIESLLAIGRANG